MKTLKTSELTGAALDWAVAKCEGIRLSGASLSFQAETHGTVCRGSAPYAPSQDWGIAGPIIEREHIGIRHHEMDETWSAGTYAFGGFGHSPLIAAMRCYVASKLGDVVEVPAELLS